MPRKVKTMSISSTAQALLDQAAHVFGSPEETRIASSDMPQDLPIHRVKRVRKPKAPSTTVSVEFPADVMVALPKRSHKKKVPTPALDTLANAAMAEVAQQIEENRTAPTHPDPIIPSPPRTGATAQALAARKAAAAARKAAAAAEAQVAAAAHAQTQDESKAMTVYEPPQSNQVALYEPPQPEPKPLPDVVMPYLSDNVNMESVQAALQPSKKVRAPRKTGGSLRGLANRASFAAQVATHSALM